MDPKVLEKSFLFNQSQTCTNYNFDKYAFVRKFWLIKILEMQSVVICNILIWNCTIRCITTNLNMPNPSIYYLKKFVLQYNIIRSNIAIWISDALVEYTLLDAINNQFDGIDFVSAEDGFPAYQFRTTADVKSPYRILLPEKLYEFAILATFRPDTRTGGYLFSVVNPLDTIVQLGIHLTPAIKDVWNVTLLYTHSDNSPASRKLVTYEIPYSKKWTTVAFQVYSNKVVFHFNCVEAAKTTVKREPVELVFDSASTLYLAQAGSILKGHFEVRRFYKKKNFSSKPEDTQNQMNADVLYLI